MMTIILQGFLFGIGFCLGVLVVFVSINMIGERLGDKRENQLNRELRRMQNEDDN